MFIHMFTISMGCIFLLLCMSQTFDYMPDIMGKRTVETEINNICPEERAHSFFCHTLAWGPE